MQAFMLLVTIILAMSTVILSLSLPPGMSGLGLGSTHKRLNPNDTEIVTATVFTTVEDLSQAVTATDFYSVEDTTRFHTVRVPNVSGTRAFGERYSDAVAYQGKIYSAPDFAHDLIVYDTMTDQTSVKSTKSLVPKDSMFFPNWQTITELAGKIYAAPGESQQLLIYDVEADQISGVSTSSVSNGFWCGITSWKGKIYATPFNADRLLIYDPDTRQVSGSGSTTSICRSGYGKWMGAAAAGGKIFAAPLDLGNTCDQLLIYDIDTGIVSGVSTAAHATGPWKWHGMAALDGKVFAVPSNADAILIYDVETQVLTSVSTRAISVGQHKWAGFTVYGGKLYGGPQASHQILVYDPIMGRVSGLPVESASDGISVAWNGIVAWADKLYCPPFDTETFLVYNISNAI